MYYKQNENIDVCKFIDEDIKEIHNLLKCDCNLFWNEWKLFPSKSQLWYLALSIPKQTDFESMNEVKLLYVLSFLLLYDFILFFW